MPRLLPVPKVELPPTGVLQRRLFGHDLFILIKLNNNLGAEDLCGDKTKIFTTHSDGRYEYEMLVRPSTKRADCLHGRTRQTQPGSCLLPVSKYNILYPAFNNKWFSCGNYGLGATCSFFAWVQTTTVVQPIAIQPVQPSQQMQTQQVPPQPTQQTTNARSGGSLSPRSPKLPRAIERERPKISALTVALKTRCKVNEPELELNRLPAKVVEGMDGELENFLSGNVAQRRRSRSSSSNKLKKSTDGIEDGPLTPATKDVEESSASPEVVSSPYYSSSSPIHIPKTPERRMLFDKLNELDRIQQKNQKMMEKGARRFTNTYPVTHQTPISGRRACFTNDEADDSEEDFYSFPCPSLPTSPELPFHHQHKQIHQTQIGFIRYEERG